MSQLRLRIPGMNCRHGLRAITAALRDVPGVETITADCRTETAILTGTMGGDEVCAALTRSGYHVEDLW